MGGAVAEGALYASRHHSSSAAKSALLTGNTRTAVVRPMTPSVAAAPSDSRPTRRSSLKTLGRSHPTSGSTSPGSISQRGIGIVLHTLPRGPSGTGVVKSDGSTTISCDHRNHQRQRRTQMVGATCQPHSTKHCGLLRVSAFSSGPDTVNPYLRGLHAHVDHEATHLMGATPTAIIGIHERNAWWRNSQRITGSGGHGVEDLLGSCS